MIGFIFGEQGTGKTKAILNMANHAVKEAKGSVVFIDDDNDYMYDLSNRIRFINTEDYDIHTPKMLYGFLSGIAAMDFDIEYIFIDGFIRIAKHPLSTLEEMLVKLDKMAEARKVNLIVSINSDGRNVSDFVRERTIHTL